MIGWLKSAELRSNPDLMLLVNRLSKFLNSHWGYSRIHDNKSIDDDLLLSVLGLPRHFPSGSLKRDDSHVIIVVQQPGDILCIHQPLQIHAGS